MEEDSNKYQYECLDCKETVILTEKSQIRCTYCSYRILRKKRSDKPVQFEAR
ncbi:metallothionein-I transcription activator [Tubulinosema ratisbonensis]|uniref:Metallothionein-I transcription activator n=1 Tax=Tubulinosema ratisbonensis TaxID=291195 RepID=A0A437AQH1_9MICR|nr:metallothionein-I transcription activator [Tubulinosema ratisbonensis]